MRLNLIVIIVTSLGIFACSNETEYTEVEEMTRLDSLKVVYEENPTNVNAAAIVTEYIDIVEDFTYDEEKSDSYERIGFYSEKINNPIIAISGYIWALKADQNNPKAEEMIYRVAKLYTEESEVPINGQFMFKSYIDRFPNGKYIDEAKEKYTHHLDFESYIDSLGNHITSRTSEIRQDIVRAYIDAVELYASTHPDEEISPTYILKASMLLQTLKEDDKMLTFLDWILKKFPDSPEAESALFSKGIYYAVDSKDTIIERSIYEEYEEKYPNGKHQEDIDFLKSRIGKPLFGDD